MDPDEALKRFIGTIFCGQLIGVDPDKLSDNIKLGKKRGPPKRPPGIEGEPSRPKGKA
jgi:hypothetical protein